MGNKTTSQVAQFISARLDETGQLQKDVAHKAGFGQPNIITMIKQGQTRLPLDKVGPMALALEVDPVSLMHMCLEEYYPTTWEAIVPFMERSITEDERALLVALRASIGGPFLAAISDDSRSYLNRFIHSLRVQSSVH